MSPPFERGEVAVSPNVHVWQGGCEPCGTKFGLLNTAPEDSPEPKPTQCPYCGQRCIYLDTRGTRQ